MGANEGAVEIAGHHGLPLVKAGVANRFENSHPGVVHQRVESAPVGLDSGHGIGHLGGLTHIGHHGQYLAQGRQVGGGTGQLWSVPIQQGHAVAAVQQMSGNGLTNAPRRACDQGHPGCERGLGCARV